MSGMTSESLWNYYRNEVNDYANENAAAGNYRRNNKTRISRSFRYKTIIGSTPSRHTLETEIVTL